MVVDSDVDITDLHEVIWAMSTRCDPSTEVQFMRNVWTSPADPAIPPATRHMKEGVTTLRHGYRMDRVLINACRPYEWFTDFPKVNAFPRDFKAEISRKWDL